MNEEYTRDETVAAWIADQLQDGETVSAGTNLSVPRAGVLLAHLTECPNLQVLLTFYQHNFADGQDPPEIGLTEDGRLRYGAERSTMHHGAGAFTNISNVDVFFVGGLQIDRHGNTNLIGISGDGEELRVRGAGPAGASSFAAEVGRYYIYMTRHTPRSFVEECDYVSTVGPSRREKLGLPGGGPKKVISPLGIFGFDQRDQLQLEARIPGVETDEIQAATGFDLSVDEPVGELDGPTADQLDVLRRRIDKQRQLREQ
jgi:glutaconate CoA-transferase subunit B